MVIIAIHILLSTRYLLNEQDGIDEQGGHDFFFYYMKKKLKGGQKIFLWHEKLRAGGPKNQKSITEAARCRNYGMSCYASL